MKIDWRGHVLDHAANIVRQYATSVTLRQLFYRLVSDQTIPNTLNAYKGLSRHSAEARRDGWFPDLIDPGRRIYRYQTWESPADAIAYMRRVYRRPRDEGQEWAIYIGVEKLGLAEQLQSWFGDLGVSIVVLRGYASQSYVKQIADAVYRDGRPACFIYAGDFDASGEDIERDFLARTDCWDEQSRIALTSQQVIDYNLPPLPGKASDSRSAAFEAKHGELIQVELDALDPNDLRGLYQAAIDGYWEDDAYQASLDQEEEDDETLRKWEQDGEDEDGEDS